MTYKEIVDKIGQVCADHYIIRDFGYGALTDIKTVGDDGTARVNYPYVFLNPTQSSRTGQEVTYRFNLIAMDVAQEEQGYSNYLEVQSNCQQYIDDILAHLRFQTPLNAFDLTLNVNLTPFKERFQDTVAGMTATLEIVLPLPLNDCITPFTPEPQLYESWTDATFTPGLAAMRIEDLVESPGGRTNWSGTNRFTFNQTLKKVELIFNLEYWADPFGSTPTLIDNIRLGTFPGGILPDESTLPQVVTAPGESTYVKLVWEPQGGILINGTVSPYDQFRLTSGDAGDANWTMTDIEMKTYV